MKIDLDRKPDGAMLRYVREALRQRIVCCEDAAAGKENHGAEAKQAISEEALWLSALFTQINDYLETGATPYSETVT